jgi:BMFP domain-containing protein YqiC
MQTQNRFLDDLARVASGAIGVAAGVREEMEARLRDQFERILTRMDLVTREEFEAVRAMAVKAREEQESLAKRLAALEAKAGGGKAAKPRTGKAGEKPVKKSRPEKRDRTGK